MLSLISSLLFASAVTARPSWVVGRQEPVEIGGFQIAATNKVIPVVVGGPQDVFVPNTVKAAVGDIIQFQFSNGNHTVTQSAKDAPCQPLQATVATAIHSGHIPFVDGQTEVGTFNMPVTNAETMFLYCATGPHCQEGQVMVVNPTSDEEIVDYAKGSQSTDKSVDGTTVVGGTVGTIALADAAFVPAPAEEEAAAPPPPPAAEAPADSAAVDPAATSTAAADPAATATTTAAAGGETLTTTVAAGATITLPGGVAAIASLPGTTTVVVTVPAAEATPAA